MCGNDPWYTTLVPYGSHGSYTHSTEVYRKKLKAFRQHPISTGPYKYIEHVKRDYILLERFDD